MTEGERDNSETGRTSDRYNPGSAVPAQSVERLTAAVTRLERRYSGWVAFRNGILAGLGSSLGVVVVFSLLLWVLARLDFLPAASSLRQFIESYLSNGR